MYMPGPGTSADEPMNTPDFVCGISPGSIAAAGRDTAVTARPVASCLLCRRRPEGIRSPAEEGLCQGERQIYIAFLRCLLRGEPGSLSEAEAYLGRDSDVIETVLRYSRVDDLRSWARVGSCTVIKPWRRHIARSRRSVACASARVTDTLNGSTIDHRFPVALTNECLTATRARALPFT